MKFSAMLAGAVIVFAALAAYHNSFSVPFILDDWASITENPTIRQLWPIWVPLSPPIGKNQGRPLANLSFAINYAVGGTEIRWYHALNLLIHILAGLTLFGVVGRTLRQPTMRERFGTAALPLALATAVIWTVHPLQTEAVTYIVQRAESLMGLFYLLTLYWFIRGAESRSPVIWYTFSVAACLLGMGSKEVMVSAPLMVLLYDRTFVAGSFREALHRRWALYLALAITWIALGYEMFSTAKGGGYLVRMSRWKYVVTQLYAIAHYLQLSVWPHPLVFDYGKHLVGSISEIVPYALIVALLLGGTLISLWRWPAVGFIGIWFFVILSPTSSVVPLAAQTMAERRMYLSLAAVVTVIVVGAVLLGKKLLRERQKLGRVLGWGVGGAVALLLTILTVHRNVTYGSELALWQDTVNKFPSNSRAQTNLGLALFEMGRVEDAIAHYAEALRIDPGSADSAKARTDLGIALFRTGKTQDAIRQLEQAVQIDPRLAAAHNNLGNALIQAGQFDDAIRQLEQAVQIDPRLAAAHNNLGKALIQAGRVEEGIRHYEEAVRIKPADDKAHFGLALALVHAGRVEEAVKDYEQVVRVNPNHADAHNNLAWILATDGDERLRDPARAVQLAEHACELTKSRDPEILDTLAAAYAAVDRFDDAIRAAQQAISVADAASLPDLAKDIQGRLKLYKAGQPFRKKT